MPQVSAALFRLVMGLQGSQRMMHSTLGLLARVMSAYIREVAQALQACRTRAGSRSFRDWAVHGPAWTGWLLGL